MERSTTTPNALIEYANKPANAATKPAARHDGAFSIASTQGPSYECLKCGKRAEASSEHGPSTHGSVDSSTSSGNEGTFYSTYDQVVDQDVKISELDIAHGLAEWREKDGSPRRYQLGCIEEDKALLADFTAIIAKELNKLLLDDLCKVAEKTHVDNLYVAFSASQAQLSNVLRSMMTYGFERAKKEETAKWSSNPEVVLLRLEVNQEDDFVDLQSHTGDVH